MSPTIRTVLAAAVGFAAGVAAACADRRPGPAPAPEVLVHPGHMTQDGRARELRPLTVRVGDDLRQVGDRARPDAPTASVYLDVDGLPVLASFELAD
jgi:hypothetical protein